MVRQSNSSVLDSQPEEAEAIVDHRVQEIRLISTNWKYCPSADNTADLLTRGVSAEQLSSAFWRMAHHGCS